MTIDFIGVFENAFSKEFCDTTIQYFENADKCGLTLKRNKPKTLQDDTFFFASSPDSLNFVHSQELIGQFSAKFAELFELYAKNFTELHEMQGLAMNAVKIQRTNIGEGYHIWHCEAGTKALSNRVLTYTLYLNNVEEGGETEFLYQHKRVKAEMGKLIICPAYFTHTHRGNPPISNTKYIITGWVEF